MKLGSKLFLTAALTVGGAYQLMDYADGVDDERVQETASAIEECGRDSRMMTDECRELVMGAVQIPFNTSYDDYIARNSATSIANQVERSAEDDVFDYFTAYTVAVLAVSLASTIVVGRHYQNSANESNIAQES